MAEALAELKLMEDDVKECERRIRFSRDFDSIMDFFAAIGALRRREAQLRDLLIMDLALAEKTTDQVRSSYCLCVLSPLEHDSKGVVICRLHRLLLTK